MSLIPIRSRPSSVRGYGIRNTLNLEGVRQALDKLLLLRLGPFAFRWRLFRHRPALPVHHLVQEDQARPGHAAVGYDMAVADMPHPGGPDPHRGRHHLHPARLLRAVIFLQNMGNVATYNATTRPASRGGSDPGRGRVGEKGDHPNVFIGVVLLHLLFVVSPGQPEPVRLGHDRRVFRQFIGYGVIALSWCCTPGAPARRPSGPESCAAGPPEGAP